ncbi:MAG: isocitrate/isopropylmalate family dehydrogenase [Bacteroidales bacterium]|nr:isocitrate/isopropylmalate family dehydrogenase [Bacteroidales bacterium]
MRRLSFHPPFRAKGIVYSSPIVGLRQHFGLDICVRPCRSYKGNPLNFIRRGKDGNPEEPMVDVVIFRQNTEGLYGGVEWSNPPQQVYDALMTHPKFRENFGWCPKKNWLSQPGTLPEKIYRTHCQACF